MCNRNPIQQFQNELRAIAFLLGATHVGIQLDWNFMLGSKSHCILHCNRFPLRNLRRKNELELLVDSIIYQDSQKRSRGAFFVIETS